MLKSHLEKTPTTHAMVAKQQMIDKITILEWCCTLLVSAALDPQFQERIYGQYWSLKTYLDIGYEERNIMDLSPVSLPSSSILSSILNAKFFFEKVEYRLRIAEI